MSVLVDRMWWYESADLAGKPGMQTSQQGINKWGKTKPRTRKKALNLPGRGWLYPATCLPKETLEALEAERLQALRSDAQLGSETDAPPPERLPTRSKATPRADGAVIIRGLIRRPADAAQLTDKDRLYRDQAMVLVRAVEGIMIELDCSELKACGVVARAIVSEAANAEVIRAAADTYIKKRAGGNSEQAQRSRLQKIMAAYRQGLAEGDATRYMVAGKRRKDGQKPEDIREFLWAYCRPTRPGVSMAWRLAEEWYARAGVPRPAIDTFYRINKSLPVTVKYHGRMTGAAMKALKPYIKRDVSMFSANDIWVGDGHSFKARVMHPDSGKPFKPEITVIEDWVSRKVIGWSVALAESTIAVSAAFRHAQMQTRARPLIYYSDNGSGQCGKHIDHPITGTASRQGFDHQTGIPGNPQGRGVIERLWSSTLIPLAQTYPTCLANGTDKEHMRKVATELAKADRRGEISPLVPSWELFLEDLEVVFEVYNDHPHKGLGGQTPNQDYEAKLDPNSLVFDVDDDELQQLWMPEELRTPQRGVIRLFNNEYFRKDLVNILKEGEQVRVRFDIHNAEKVWLYRLDGSPIGEAVWRGNSRAAFAVDYVDRKRAERAAGIKKRAEREIARADEEMRVTVEAPALEKKDESKTVQEWMLEHGGEEEPEPVEKMMTYAETQAFLGQTEPEPVEKQMSVTQLHMWLNDIEDPDRE